MLAFLMTIADEQYSAKIERLYHRYHKPMLRIAKQRFANAKRSNPGLDAEVYVATGKALANTSYGSGGFTQYYIDQWAQYVEFSGKVFDLKNIP